MTRLRLAGLVLGVLAAGLPVAAHADGIGYVGTCRITTVNDTTPDGTLGGPRVWNGEVDIAVAPSTVGDQITAAGCYVKVTASGSESKILDATVLGAAAYGAGRATYTADRYDTVFLCTHVTTGTGGAEDNCTPLTTTPVCPDQICGVGGLLDQIVGLLGAGTTKYSAACDGGVQVVDSDNEGVHVKVYVLQPTTGETDVCVRVEDATTGEGVGGEFVVTPSAAVLPSTDTSSGLCTTTTPNSVPGMHPITSTGVLGQQVVLDAYADPTAVWVCLSAGTAVTARVVVPVPALAGGSVVTFHADPAGLPLSVLSAYVHNH